MSKNNSKTMSETCVYHVDLVSSMRTDEKLLAFYKNAILQLEYDKEILESIRECCEINSQGFLEIYIEEKQTKHNNSGIKILPIIRNKVFEFLYKIENFKIDGIEDIFLVLVSLSKSNSSQSTSPCIVDGTEKYHLPLRLSAVIIPYPLSSEPVSSKSSNANISLPPSGIRTSANAISDILGVKFPAESKESRNQSLLE